MKKKQALSKGSDDPISRVLREMGIPNSLLLRMEEGEPLETGEFFCDVWRAYPPGTSTRRWETDGRVKVLHEERNSKRHINQYCADEVRRSIRIAGASYAISCGHYVEEGGAIVGRVWWVAVWPNCDPKVLKEALAPIVYWEGADGEYPAALKDFNAARRWIAKRFKISPHPEKGDRIIVNGGEFKVESEYLRPPCTLAFLLHTHGVELIEEHLGEKQKWFLRAKQDVEEAARYVFSHYRVVAVKRGNERHLKFALQGSPDKLGDIDSVYLNHQEELPLKILLETHKSLKDVLFARAKEQMELVPSYSQPSRFFLEGGVWMAEHYTDQRGWHTYPLVREENAIVVGLNEFSKVLRCLSDPERQERVVTGSSFHAVLQDGDEAYINGYTALLPVRPGETKNFLFRLADYSSFTSSIWGVTVRRTQDGVVYEPYDNGFVYTCAGYWGSEVSRKPIA